ncbi:DUF2283 domain-containing protein [Leifsonia poae]|uniref:DUF2283 domain-containing protein n=1 Tax=Leifsonia poae TaxID=110933 RepID=UPI001CC049B7|nr:DUF2283 domain-containing protein [Leifsonia poae]
MRLTYDPELDVASLRLDDTAGIALADRASTAHTPNGGAYIDAEYDADGYLIGFEVLGAGQLIHPEVLAAAERVTRH